MALRILLITVLALAAFLHTSLWVDVLSTILAVAALILHFILHHRVYTRLTTLLLLIALSILFGDGLLHYNLQRTDWRIVALVSLLTVYALFEAISFTKKSIEKENAQRENHLLYALIFYTCAVLITATAIVAPISKIPLAGYSYTLLLCSLPVLGLLLLRIFNGNRRLGLLCCTAVALLLSASGIGEAFWLNSCIDSADRERLVSILERRKSNDLSISALKKLLADAEDDPERLTLLKRYGNILPDEEYRRLVERVLFRLLSRVKSIDEKLAVFEDAVRLLPDDARLLSLYAVLLDGAGRKRKAVQVARIAVTIDARLKEAWRILINDALARDDFEKAVELSIKGDTVVDTDENTRLHRYILALAEADCWRLIDRLLENREDEHLLGWRAAALVRLNRRAEAEKILRGKGDENLFLLARPKPSPEELKKISEGAVYHFEKVSLGLALVGYECTKTDLRRLETFSLKLFLQKRLPVDNVDLMVWLGSTPIYRRVVDLSKRRLGEIFCEEFNLRVPYSSEVGESELRICRFVGKRSGRYFDLDEERLRFIRVCGVKIGGVELPELSEEERKRLLSELPEGKNLLRNSSFEQPLEVDWGTYRPSMNYRYFRDFSTAVDGNASLCMDFWDFRRSLWHFRQAVGVKEKTLYEVGLVYRADGFDDRNRMLLLVRDADREWRILNRFIRLPETERWRVAKFRFLTPAGTRRVRVYIHRYVPGDADVTDERWSCSGTLWVDGIFLVEVTEEGSR